MTSRRLGAEWYRPAAANAIFRQRSRPSAPSWPGTYQDTAQAIDYLRTLAPKYKLDLERVVFVGHSAGGHLAHWAAARSKLKPSSLLYSPDPLKPAGVINLAGRMDMSDGIAAYEATCGEPVVRQLLGGMPEDVPERYVETSPAALLPLDVAQVMIWGSREEYVPQSQAERYVAMATKAGDQARLIVGPGAGTSKLQVHLRARGPRFCYRLKPFLVAEDEFAASKIGRYRRQSCHSQSFAAVLKPVFRS